MNDNILFGKGGGVYVCVVIVVGGVWGGYMCLVVVEGVGKGGLFAIGWCHWECEQAVGPEPAFGLELIIIHTGPTHTKPRSCAQGARDRSPVGLCVISCHTSWAHTDENIKSV